MEKEIPEGSIGFGQYLLHNLLGGGSVAVITVLFLMVGVLLWVLVITNKKESKAEKQPELEKTVADLNDQIQFLRKLLTDQLERNKNMTDDYTELLSELNSSLQSVTTVMVEIRTLLGLKGAS